MNLKPVILIFLLVSSLGATAQKIAIWQGSKEVTNRTQEYKLTVNERFQQSLFLENNTNEELTIWIEEKALDTKSTKRSEFYWKANSHKQAKMQLPKSERAEAVISFQSGQPATETYRYQVFFRNATGFTDSVSVQIQYQVQQQQRSYENLEMSLYPNPVQTELSIAIKEMPGTCQVVIYNNIGQQVRKIHLSDAREITRIQVSELNSGLYFASVVKDDEILLTKRFLVNH